MSAIEPFSPPAVVSLRPGDRVVSALRTGVQMGRYAPGQKLIEADLVAVYGVSRATVREALARLAADGLVTLVPNRGAFIRSLSRAEVDDMLEVAGELMGLAAYRAAAAIGDPRHREALEQTYEDVVAYRRTGREEELLRARAAFYDTVVRIGGNSELCRVVPLVQLHLLRLQFHSLVSEGDRGAQLDEYDVIAACILAGDTRKSKSAMRRHLRMTRARIARLPAAVFRA